MPVRTDRPSRGGALAATLVVAGALAFGALTTYVWPTRWRPLAIHGPAAVLAARQDRFTGRVEVLTLRGGWRAIPFGRAAGAVQAGALVTPSGATAAVVVPGGATSDDPLAGYTPGWDTARTR